MKLFIFDRDSNVGEYVGESIKANMDRCLCVIIVFSEALLENEWTAIALREAVVIRRSGLRSKVCLIKLGNPKRKNIPKEFTPLLFPQSFLPVPVLSWCDNVQLDTKLWRKLKVYLLSWEITNVQCADLI